MTCPTSKKTNKVKVEIEMTCEQRKDFMWAINDILRLGALTQGRAAQLLAIDYKSGHYEQKNENSTSPHPAK